MNKVRRKQLEEVMLRLVNLRDELESIMQDEEEYRDNIPENLQSSEKYEKADDACSYLQTAIDAFDEIAENIESACE